MKKWRRKTTEETTTVAASTTTAVFATTATSEPIEETRIKTYFYVYESKETIEHTVTGQKTKAKRRVIIRQMAVHRTVSFD